MRINASDYPDFAAAIAVADRMKYISGSTLYLPGREEPYDGDGLTIPANTQIVGDVEKKSKISGRMTWGSFIGGQEIAQVRFLDGLDIYGARNSMLRNVHFNGTVTCREPDYYNMFLGCRWSEMGDQICLELTGPCNFNHLIGCRITTNGLAVECLPDHRGFYAGGWHFDKTAFEGEFKQTAGTALHLQGRSHTIRECWFEAHKYNDITIILGDSSRQCSISDNVMGRGVTIENNGTDNYIRQRFEAMVADS